MRKLLIVTDAWAPQVNGVANVLAGLVSELEKRGVSVKVAHPGLFKRAIPLPFYREIFIALFPGAQMRRIFERERPDYIHIATEGTLGLAARKACLRKGLAFTTSFHTNFALYMRHYFRFGNIFAFFAAQYLRRFHRPAGAVFASTPTLKEKLERDGYGAVALSPLGIDTHRFVRDESRAPKIDGPRPVSVYMGRVAKEKNIEEYLAADIPGTKLVIGDGPARKKLEKRYGEKAVFAGYKRGQELADWLSAGDVCVFPSRTETFGLSMVEALACGLPVAAHDVMGPRDVITPGVDGVLDEDIGRAARAAASLSREACREKALRFSLERSAEAFLRNIERFPAR